MWHHFGGPKAQAIANDTVFRFDDGAIVAEQAGALDELWHRIGRARILTATRGLPTGARALNAHLHELALDNMTVTGKPEFVPGEPVMITANDYQRGLYNGDQGIIVRADEGTGHHRYRAVFRVGTRLVPFAIEALRDRLELAWALTIHKSQGSELEAVALVLPEDDLPLVTRELIYTGITRARTRSCCVARARRSRRVPHGSRSATAASPIACAPSSLLAVSSFSADAERCVRCGWGSCAGVMSSSKHAGDRPVPSLRPALASPPCRCFKRTTAVAAQQAAQVG